MVCAGEEELCPTGYGTEFPDEQAVVVDGIVIKHVVLFKIGRVMDEIVVHRVRAHRDIGAFDCGAQVDSLFVTRARI